jgi:hypothetical protein
MPLNDLKLDELGKMLSALEALRLCGNDLDAQGYAPTFDLTPGRPASIRLDWSMPEVTAAAPPAAAPADRARDPLDSMIRRAVWDYETRSAEDDHTHSAAPSRSKDAETPVPQVTADVEGAADSGGGLAVAAAEPPAAPLPGTARALAATLQPGGRAAPWTPEEDARLIDLVCQGVQRQGLSRRGATMAAAQELGRPFDGTEFRCRHKLKDRLDAALAKGPAWLDQPEEVPTPYADAALAHAESLDEGGATDQPAVPAHAIEPLNASPRPEHIADAITAHVVTLTDKGGWSLERDLQLVELSIGGWTPTDIAAELQMPDTAIKPRFDALTGLYTDETTGKKLRRCTREEVQKALLALVALEQDLQGKVFGERGAA